MKGYDSPLLRLQRDGAAAVDATQPQGPPATQRPPGVTGAGRAGRQIEAPGLRPAKVCHRSLLTL